VKLQGKGDGVVGGAINRLRKKDERIMLLTLLMTARRIPYPEEEERRGLRVGNTQRGDKENTFSLKNTVQE
jgi:hypothetical protein